MAIHNETYSEYAARDGIRASDVVTFLKGNTINFYREREDGYLLFGKALHLAMQGQEEYERDVVVVRAVSFRTKQAKAEKMFAISEGKVPILEKDHTIILRMRGHIIQELERDGIATSQIQHEVSIDAVEPESGIKLKGRLDGVVGRVILDYKTTRDIASLKKEDFWVQPAHYRFLLALHLGCAPSEVEFKFIFIEKQEPYPVKIINVAFAPERLGELFEVYRKLTQQQANTTIDTDKPDHTPRFERGDW